MLSEILKQKIVYLDNMFERRLLHIIEVTRELDFSGCGPVYKIVIKKNENHFDVDVLVNTEVLENFYCLPFGELLGLVRSLVDALLV